MAKFKITTDKITQFYRATCTNGDEKTAIAYLESEEGLVDGAVKSYQADQRHKMKLAGSLSGSHIKAT